jgi:hypothetical protein
VYCLRFLCLLRCLALERFHLDGPSVRFSSPQLTINPKGTPASFNELCNLHGRSLADGANKADARSRSQGSTTLCCLCFLMFNSRRQRGFILKSQTPKVHLTRPVGQGHAAIMPRPRKTHKYVEVGQEPEAGRQHSVGKDSPQRHGGH